MSVKRFLDKVSARDKDCVFGYFRENVKKLKMLSVPMLVQYCCLQFYFEYDEFDKCSKNIEIIGKHRDKIQLGQIVSSLWTTTYGKIEIIGNMIYEWTFKVHEWVRIICL